MVHIEHKQNVVAWSSLEDPVDVAACVVNEMEEELVHRAAVVVVVVRDEGALVAYC